MRESLARERIADVAGHDWRMKGLGIHWAWVPAGVFVVAVGWHRYGWWTLLMVLAGLALGIGLRARK